MSDLQHPSDEPSLAEVTVRRTAAHTQWQKALARAKERFTPANVRDEAINNAAEAVGGAADKVGSLAWAHRGKLAIAGLLGGLVVFRKPVAEVAGPLAVKARASIDTATSAIKDRLKS
ncbi:hypothetical protein [Blastomonas sp.]|uniref:hypothetical protein n=1 Tax=Blastomonas sp. TaxID=1909299 RepID=UPI0026392F59|nr:hypothetical protein [Blastomonas sp.]MDM7955627.1 hypothetical protein [Blastomonas sp.]